MSRNRSGAYVVSQMAGLESYTTEFETAPTTVALGSLSLAVYITDPSGRYLPRKVQVPLPRDPDLARAANAESLFSAARVLLYPAPAAPIYPGWAIVRASVRSESTNAGVPHAWLRIRRASQPVHTNSPLGVGMADARGEALVAVTGIPVTNWSEEGETLLATEVDALIDAYADSTVESPPNPDTIETKRETLPFTCQNSKACVWPPMHCASQVNTSLVVTTQEF